MAKKKRTVVKRFSMFTLALAIIFAAPPTSPPDIPAQRPWIGGPWTGDDADKGKDFPKGAFLYTPKAEHEAYVKAAHKWLADAKDKTPVRFKAYGIQDALPSLRFSPDDKSPTVSASGPLKAYGGSGTIEATYGIGTRSITISLRNVDFEAMSEGLAMSIPVRVSGTVGRMAGTVEGNRGTFVGTEVKSSGVTIRRLDLSVDYATGLYTATADTSFGPQTIKGRLREAK